MCRSFNPSELSYIALNIQEHKIIISSGSTSIPKVKINYTLWDCLLGALQNIIYIPVVSGYWHLSKINPNETQSVFEMIEKEKKTELTIKWERKKKTFSVLICK